MLISKSEWKIDKSVFYLILRVTNIKLFSKSKSGRKIYINKKFHIFTTEKYFWK